MVTTKRIHSLADDDDDIDDNNDNNNDDNDNNDNDNDDNDKRNYVSLGQIHSLNIFLFCLEGPLTTVQCNSCNTRNFKCNSCSHAICQPRVWCLVISIVRSKHNMFFSLSGSAILNPHFLIVTYCDLIVKAAL